MATRQLGEARGGAEGGHGPASGSCMCSPTPAGRQVAAGKPVLRAGAGRGLHRLRPLGSRRAGGPSGGVTLSLSPGHVGGPHCRGPVPRPRPGRGIRPRPSPFLRVETKCQREALLFSPDQRGDRAGERASERDRETGWLRVVGPQSVARGPLRCRRPFHNNERRNGFCHCGDLGIDGGSHSRSNPPALPLEPARRRLRAHQRHAPAVKEEPFLL